MSIKNAENLNTSGENIPSYQVKIPKWKKKKAAKVEEPKSEKDIELDKSFPSLNSKKSSNLGKNTRWHYIPGNSDTKNNKANVSSSSIPQKKNDNSSSSHINSEKENNDIDPLKIQTNNSNKKKEIENKNKYKQKKDGVNNPDKIDNDDDTDKKRTKNPKKINRIQIKTTIQKNDDSESDSDKRIKKIKNKQSKNAAGHNSSSDDNDEHASEIKKNKASKPFNDSDEEESSSNKKLIRAQNKRNIIRNEQNSTSDENDEEDYIDKPKKPIVKKKSTINNDEEYDEESSSNKKVKKNKNKQSKETKNFKSNPKKQPEPKRSNKKSANTQKKSPKKKSIPETVIYKTYIELDMHGDDKRIKKVFDWVPIIRDALFDAVERKVDKVYFITGKGKHSKEKKAVLQPLVLLTAKRLGFDTKLKKENSGVVECDITTYNEICQEEEEKEEEDNEYDEDEDETYISQENANLYKTFGVGKVKFNDYDDKKVSLYDDIDDAELEKNYHYKKSVYKAVKKRYSYMPNICIEIISMGRDKKHALKFAENFQKALNKNDFEGNANYSIRKSKSDIKNPTIDRNEENIKEMKMVKSLVQEYGLDKEIVSLVVHEKKNKKKARIILDRIANEIPDEFYVYLAVIFSDYNVLPSKTLLDIAKEKNYVYEDVNEALISKSVAAAGHALDVLKVNNKIASTRKDGSPKFIPIIEIDLSKAGTKKAEITIERIMSGLSNGSYSQMVLKFSKDLKYCQIDDVRPIIKKIAREEGVCIREVFKKVKNRYSFAIINDDHDFENDEKEEEEEDINSNVEEDDVYSSANEPDYSSEDDF